MAGDVLAYAPKWNKQYTAVAEAPAILTVEEAAILFKLPQDQIRNLCKNKTFIAYKLHIAFALLCNAPRHNLRMVHRRGYKLGQRDQGR